MNNFRWKEETGSIPPQKKQKKYQVAIRIIQSGGLESWEHICDIKRIASILCLGFMNEDTIWVC